MELRHRRPEYRVRTELLSRSVHGVELTTARKALIDHWR